jgi:selenocysteine lyase/cysteine desulfurase
MKLKSSSHRNTVHCLSFIHKPQNTKMNTSTPLDLAFLRSEIVGINTRLNTPFGQRLLTYADYTASGRSLQFVEDYLLAKQALYANSHTEDDTTGRITTELLHVAEEHIKSAVNAGPGGRIISTGTGATGAIDRMQQIVGVRLSAASRQILQQLANGYLGKEQARSFDGFCEQHQPVVFVGPYEHHSNEISWREGLATVIEVKLNEEGGVDLAHLEALLKEPEYLNRLRIGSFSAASNVTGMITPVHEIARLLHRHDALAFFDYAASAPYVAIDMNPDKDDGIEGDVSMDAIFISPHKFLGGPGASGVLIFNERTYHQELPPTLAAGGTVDYVGPQSHTFIADIEAREKGGTPGILQTLKAAMVFNIKESIGIDVLEAREQELTRRALERWNAHPNIEVLGNPDPKRRVGIISFNILSAGKSYLHPRFVTTLLDELFGIQSRAGCSCAGPYGHQLLGIDETRSENYQAWINKGFNGIKPGWCRVGFHYVFDDIEAQFLIDAVEFIAEFGDRFLALYDFDQFSGVWRHKDSSAYAVTLSVNEALATRLQPQQAEPPISEKLRGGLYQSYLKEALVLAQTLPEADQESLFPTTPSELNIYQGTP